MAGDFHHHTCYTDGRYSLGGMASHGLNYGLDWWAHSEHGGVFSRHGGLSGLDLGQTVYWDQYPGATILGEASVNANGHTNMWRWQSLRDFQFDDVLAARAAHPGYVLALGLEWNMPGYSHCSVGMISNQFNASPSAAGIAEFEYRYDAGDTDLAGGAAQGWVKSTAAGRAKSLEAVAWLQANHPGTSWAIAAHPERRDVFDVAAFRDLNNAAPDVCFGFESMPGHQASAQRGGYDERSVGGCTYGGCGIYAAEVGGVWDALLGEGRRWWLFANSDFHNASSCFWPGQYLKTWTFAEDPSDMQSIVDGLRSGNGWVVQGDLIDTLNFSIHGAAMGQTLHSLGSVVTLEITVRDPPGANYGPAGHNTPSLARVDVIAGEVSGRIDPGDAAYTNGGNASARVIARFDAEGGEEDGNGVISVRWTDLGDGWKQMSLAWNTRGRPMYFRLRGSNRGLDAAGETDAAGNPLPDSLAGDNTEAKAFDDLWFYSNPLFVQPADSPTLDLKANGANGLLALPAGDPLCVTVAVESGAYAGTPVDCWLAAQTADGWRHYRAETGEWLLGVAVSAQGPLVDIPATPVFIGGAPSGLCVLYFGVDSPMDGSLDTYPLLLDTVAVIGLEEGEGGSAGSPRKRARPCWPIE